MSLNTRRSTPERALLVFAAFALLAAIAAVRDCRRRPRLEEAVSVERAAAAGAAPRRAGFPA
jgi:hypothetical protein